MLMLHLAGGNYAADKRGSAEKYRATNLFHLAHQLICIDSDEDETGDCEPSGVSEPLESCEVHNVNLVNLVEQVSPGKVATKLFILDQVDWDEDRKEEKTSNKNYL